MLGIDKVFKRLFSNRVDVVVNAAVEKAFDCVADIARHGEWFIWGRIERASEGPVGVGSTFTFTPPIFIPPMRFVFRAKGKVTEFVANERLAYEWDVMHCRLRHSFELQPAEGKTRITYGLECLHLGPLMTLMAVLASPLIVLVVIQLPISRALWWWDRRRCLRRIESRVAEP